MEQFGLNLLGMRSRFTSMQSHFMARAAPKCDRSVVLTPALKRKAALDLEQRPIPCPGRPFLEKSLTVNRQLFHSLYSFYICEKLFWINLNIRMPIVFIFFSIICHFNKLACGGPANFEQILYTPIAQPC